MILDNSAEQKKYPEYNFVDPMKFLMVILVIILHAGPVRGMLTLTDITVGNMPWNVVLRIPVPFFFIVAGFFLFRKMSETVLDFKRIKRYLWRICKLYCIWYIIYLPWIIGIARHNEHGFVLGFLYQVLLFFTSGYFHLWFLNALMVGVVLVSYLLYKKISINKVIGIAGMLYVGVLLNAPYYGVFEKFCPPGSLGFSFVHLLAQIFVTSRNGFMEGFLFVAIGAALAFRWRYISLKWVILGMIASLLLLFAEIYFVEGIAFCAVGGADVYIFLVPLTVLLVILTLEVKLPESSCWVWMRKMSMFIYYSHVLWLNFFRYLNTYCKLGLGIMQVLILTIVATVLLAAAIVKCREKPMFRWLKLLG